MLTAIPSSSCKQPGYVCNKKMITDAKTAEAYEKKLRSTIIFRNAVSFCRVCIDVLLIVIAMSSSILLFF